MCDYSALGTLVVCPSEELQGPGRAAHKPSLLAQRTAQPSEPALSTPSSPAHCAASRAARAASRCATAVDIMFSGTCTVSTAAAVAGCSIDCPLTAGGAATAPYSLAALSRRFAFHVLQHRLSVGRDSGSASSGPPHLAQQLLHRSDGRLCKGRVLQRLRAQPPPRVVQHLQQGCRQRRQQQSMLAPGTLPCSPCTFSSSQGCERPARLKAWRHTGPFAPALPHAAGRAYGRKQRPEGPAPAAGAPPPQPFSLAQHTLRMLRRRTDEEVATPHLHAPL